MILSSAAFVVASRLLKQKDTDQTPSEQTFQHRTLNLDRFFEFKGLDERGRKRTNIEVKITEVEITDQVVVQDKTYTSQNEKIFLIVNLEMKNESTKGLNIFPGDLLRLIVDDNEEKKYAPDLHNNFVLISPISTKTDRVGFVLNQEFSNLKLQIGELEGKKEIIEVNFPTVLLALDKD